MRSAATALVGLVFATACWAEDKCEMVEAPAGNKYAECDPAKIAEAKELLAKHRASQPFPPPPGHSQSVEEFTARANALSGKTEEERAAAATTAAALRAQADARDAALAKGAIAKANAAPIALKSLAPGMSVEEIRAIHPQISCDAPPKGKGLCHYFTKYAIGGASQALATLGGANVDTWQIILQDGKCAAVHVILPTEEFHLVKASMVERFGKPAAHELSIVTNRMGAKFDQATYRWTRGGSTVVIKQRGAKVDEMLVSLTSAASIREFAAGHEAEIRKGAKDF
jgi:hypothetical protein